MLLTRYNGSTYPIGPTTQEQDRTIRLVGHSDLLEFDQPPWLDTCPQLGHGKRFALPRHRVALRCAARIPPPRLAQGVLQPRPVELAIAEKHHGGPCGDHLAHHLNDGDVKVLGKMALGTLAHAPR